MSPVSIDTVTNPPKVSIIFLMATTAFLLLLFFQCFTLHGEPFAQEETEELLNAALDPTTKTIQYRSFLHYLTINEDT